MVPGKFNKVQLNAPLYNLLIFSLNFIRKYVQMTPYQKQRIELKIKKIRSILAAEKRKFGGYDDSRGLRYLPTSLYIKLQDYKGGLVYTRWFTKNFPDDAGFPDFLFEWTIILFKSGKIKDAERKATASLFRNTYIFDKFFGREIAPTDKYENWSVEQPDFLDDFKYSSDLSELADFSRWLMEFEQTERFKSLAKRFFQAKERLKYEEDPEMRSYLVRIDRQLLAEI
jgi:hypothetical protein